MRFTDVYQKQDDGSWKIVHEHLSNVPTAEGGAG
jgi:ketosteroid isomerase-like protein